MYPSPVTALTPMSLITLIVSHHLFHLVCMVRTKAPIHPIKIILQRDALAAERTLTIIIDGFTAACALAFAFNQSFPITDRAGVNGTCLPCVLCSDVGLYAISIVDG